MRSTLLPDVGIRKLHAVLVMQGTVVKVLVLV